MKYKLLLYISVLALPLSLTAQIKSKIKLSEKQVNLELEDINENYFVGFKIPVTLKLIALKNVEVFDLETAWLGYTLKFTYKDGNDLVTRSYDAGTGGSYVYINDTLSGETTYYEKEQNRVFLNRNESLRKKIELISLFNNGFLGVGKYCIKIAYEGQIETEANFQISLDFQKSIPELISSLKRKEVFGGITAYSRIYFLTGYKGFEKVSMSDYQAHFDAVPELIVWWENKKELVLKVESVLEKKEYSDLLYKERVPKLMQALEERDYQVRLAARNELHNITGLQLWEPSESDTEDKVKAQIDEVVKWWKENEDLINWVNRVLLENKL